MTDIADGAIKKPVDEKPGAQPDTDMVWIAGGEFKMGSDLYYPEERPVHDVRVDGFWIDRFLVTNEQFGRFVDATGYRTWLNAHLTQLTFLVRPEENLVPGSMLFQKTAGPVELTDYRNWWAWVPGTSWRHPSGPGSSLDGLQNHPVVHIALKMLKPMPSGLASNCPRKLNGNMLRVVGWMARILPGETGTPVRKRRLQIPGKANFHGRTC